MKMPSGQALSSEEVGLYDRQIRLWGVETQNRLRNSSVLLIGVNLVGAELAKNLILAGVKKLHLHDVRLISETVDLPVFLLTSAAQTSDERVSVAILERSRQLNPLVGIESVEDDVFEADFKFSDYDVVCLTDFDRATTCLDRIQRLNDTCRHQGVKFVVAGSFGEFGYAFFDLGTHEYFEETSDQCSSTEPSDQPVAKKLKTNDDSNSINRKVEQFVTLSTACAPFSVKQPNKRTLKTLPNGFFFFDILNQFCDQMKRNPRDSEEDDQNLTDLYEKIMLQYAEAFGNPQFEIRRFDPSNFAGNQNPVFAIIGGIASQQIITALSQNERPINNFVFFDGYDCSACKLPLS